MTEQIDISAARALHQNADYEAAMALLKDVTEPLSEQSLLLGLCKLMSGQTAAGRELIELAMAETPTNSAWSSDLALANILQGNMARAEELLLEIEASGAASGVDYGRLAAVKVAGVDLEQAIHYFREAVAREPGRKHWHHNLAGVMARRQQYEEALEHYDIALTIDPDFEQAVTLRRQLLRSMDKIAEVVADLEARLADDSDNMPLRLELARTLEADGRMTDALRALREPVRDMAELLALKEDSDSDFEAIKADQITLRMALAALWEGHSRYQLVLHLLKQVEQLEPDEELLAVRSGQVGALKELGQYEEAQQLLDELIEEQPDDNHLKIIQSQLWSEAGRYDAAEALLRELLKTYPGHANLLVNLGQTLLWTGKLDEACDSFEKASTINPMALAQLTKTHRMPADPAVIEKMVLIANNRQLKSEARAVMAFAVSEVYDKKPDYNKAFEFLALGNGLIDKSVQYAADNFSKRVSRMTERFNKAYFDQLEPIRCSDRTPIFVIGMPRSGTTLTEQILASHPQVFGAGELELLPVLTRLLPRVIKTGNLFPACIVDFTRHFREEAARYYLYGLMQHDADHPFVVDKMPHNFMNLGLIASILPGAKIVHVRRDPRDTALSNFQQNFKAKDGGMGYSFDLEKIAAQINDYHRLMQHWQRVLPLPIFDLFYEDMVEDQAATTARLLEFVGLAWDDKVTDFHRHERAVRTASVAQVRQPIYTSSRRKWRNYEAHLAPLLDQLNAEVVAPWNGDE